MRPNPVFQLWKGVLAQHHAVELGVLGQVPVAQG
jgi:hypothetical protein